MQSVKFYVCINTLIFESFGVSQKGDSKLLMAWLGLRVYPFLIGFEGLLGESRGIALLLSVYLGIRWEWVVSTTPRPP
jgi:hypothetical protein